MTLAPLTKVKCQIMENASELLRYSHISKSVLDICSSSKKHLSVQRKLMRWIIQCVIQHSANTTAHSGDAGHVKKIRPYSATGQAAPVSMQLKNYTNDRNKYWGCAVLWNAMECKPKNNGFKFRYINKHGMRNTSLALICYSELLA
jgi:hypothetical protein